MSESNSTKYDQWILANYPTRNSHGKGRLDALCEGFSLTKIIDPEWFRGLLNERRSRGELPIIEIDWGLITHTFRDEDRLMSFGREFGYAFALIVTPKFRKCFVMWEHM